MEFTGESNQVQSHLGDALLTVKKEHSRSPRRLKEVCQKPLDVAPADVEDGANGSIESSTKQLVLYDPGTSVACRDVHLVPDPTDAHSSYFQSFSAPNTSSRNLPSVGTFTVQCAKCFKWRLIPTKEKYEELRENILQDPFVCDRAREWRPDITCDDPADISQDGSRLWAIDKPNISQPPPGWERLIRIRGEGGTRFADVYYATPSGKKLRSMVEVQKYLLEHPEYIREGVNLSQFSFQIPKPLRENYVRKRTARVANPYDNAGQGLPRPLEPAEVSPISWAAPPFTCTDLKLGGPELSTSYYEPPVYHPSMELPPAKKATRPSSKQRHISSMYDQPKVKVEETKQATNASFYEL